MASVFPPVRTRLIAVLGAALVCTLTACGGPDLGKANFPRSTVPAEPSGDSQGEVPTGPITDPAVATDVLRSIDPCPLIGPEMLAELGTAAEARASGWDRCSNQVKDAGGKQISVSLQLGDMLGPEKPTGSIEGLPLIESKLEESDCFVSVLTSREPKLGITAQVKYEGGDPCRAGRIVIQQAVSSLHADPAKLDQPEGSLVGIDPCTGLADAAVGEVLPREVSKRPAGLHNCVWDSGGTDVTLRFRLGYPPSPEEQSTEVDLGGGVTAYQEMPLPDSAQCTITWLYRPIAETQGEIVSLDYTNYNGDPESDDACGKAKTLAANVVETLP